MASRPIADHQRHTIAANTSRRRPSSRLRRKYPTNSSGNATSVSDPPSITIVLPRIGMPKGMNSMCPNSWMAVLTSLTIGTLPYSLWNAAHVSQAMRAAKARRR